MSRFQTLLAPGRNTSPQQEQERASRDLPKAVKQSHLQWWTKKGSIPEEGKALLLLVAPFSHYDLALLDVLDAALARPRPARRKPPIPVYVANLQQYQSVEQLAEDIPGITRPPSQTPLAVVWEDGEVSKTASGKQARDLVADMLGMPADDLNEEVVSRVPK